MILHYKTDGLPLHEFKKVYAEGWHDRISVAVWSGDKTQMTDLLVAFIDNYNYETWDHKSRREEANELGPSDNDCADLR